MTVGQAATSVEVFTPSCHCHGKVFNRNLCLAEFLSDPASDLLRVADASLQLHGSHSNRFRCAEVLVRKSEVLMTIPLGQGQPPLRRVGPRPKKNRHGVLLVLPGHVLMGIVQLPERSDPLALLSQGSTLSSFVGLTDAVLYNAASGEASRNFEVAIVRRASIEAIYLDAGTVGNSEQSSGTFCDGRGCKRCNAATIGKTEQSSEDD
jgi:hypothetical protein